MRRPEALREVEVDGFADGENDRVALEALHLVGRHRLAAAGGVVLAEARLHDFDRLDVALGVADDAVRRRQEDELRAFFFRGLRSPLRWPACLCARGDRRRSPRAPMRSAVRAESMAALPPPMTATLRPEAHGLVLAQPTPGTEAPGRRPSTPCRAGRPRIPSRFRWRGRRRRNCSSSSLSEMSKPTRVLKTNFTPRRSISSISRRSTDLGRRYSGRAKRSMPPASGCDFVDRDVVAEQRQIEGRGEAGGAGAGNGDLAAGGRQLARRDALRPCVRSGPIDRWSRR